MPRQRVNAPGRDTEGLASMHSERYPDWLMDRFWAKVTKVPDGCWVWTASRTGSGYGQFRDTVADRRVDVHRFSYEYHHGPIPMGLVIDHLCNTKTCVNPDHLEATTQRANNLRGVGPAALNEFKTHCPQGHPYSGDNLRLARDGGRICRRCHNARVMRRQMQPENLTDRQRSALTVACRNGRWWVNGKGSNMIVAGLEQRGLAERRWELIAGRVCHYLVPTERGRGLLERPTVIDLEAERWRKGA